MKLLKRLIKQLILAEEWFHIKLFGVANFEQAYYLG